MWLTKLRNLPILGSLNALFHCWIVGNFVSHSAYTTSLKCHVTTQKPGIPVTELDRAMGRCCSIAK